MCDNQLVNGITRGGGCMSIPFIVSKQELTSITDAEYCTIRSEAAVRIPPDVDAATYAPMLCAGVTVFNSMRQMQVPPGSTVAIQGLGGLGHLALQYANKFGYRVVALSRDSKKEKFARQLGAHEYIDGSKEDIGGALQKLGGASLIVSTAPDKASITPLLSGLGIKGKLLILSSKLYSQRTLNCETVLITFCLVVDDLPVNTGILVSVSEMISTIATTVLTDSQPRCDTDLQSIHGQVDTQSTPKRQFSLPACKISSAWLRLSLSRKQMRLMVSYLSLHVSVI